MIVVQDVSEDFRVTIKEVLASLFVEKEFAFCWAQERVWVFLERVSPRLEPPPGHIDEHFLIFGLSSVLQYGGRGQGARCYGNPTDGSGPRKRQPGRCHRSHVWRNISSCGGNSSWNSIQYGFPPCRPSCCQRLRNSFCRFQMKAIKSIIVMRSLGNQIIAWPAWHRGLRINLRLMIIPRKKQWQITAALRYFFRWHTKQDLTWEPWKNIYENLSQGRSVDLHDCFDYICPGKVWVGNFFFQTAITDWFLLPRYRILVQTFFNHFEVSLDLYFATFSAVSIIEHRSHYLIAIVSTRQLTCLTGEKIYCNQSTNSPSLLEKDCAPLQINFFYWRTKRKRAEKRSSSL